MTALLNIDFSYAGFAPSSRQSCPFAAALFSACGQREGAIHGSTLLRRGHGGCAGRCSFDQAAWGIQTAWGIQNSIAHRLLAVYRRRKFIEGGRRIPHAIRCYSRAPGSTLAVALPGEGGETGFQSLSVGILIALRGGTRHQQNTSITGSHAKLRIGS